MAMPPNSLERDREAIRARRRLERQRKAARKPGVTDPTGRKTRFPSAFPEAPEAFDGIARTLSRGL